MHNVKVVLTNRWAKFVGTYPKQELEKHFRFHPTGWQWMPKVQSGEWDGWIRLLRYNKVGSGLFLAARSDIEAGAMARFTIVQDTRTQPSFKPYLPNPDIDPPRNYQLDCIDRMIAAAATGGLITSATGTGKTYVTGTFLRRLVGQACFIVDELTLLAQAQEELSKVAGEPVGKIGEGDFNPARLTVATIQTLHSRHKQPFMRKWMAGLGVVIVDEFHTALNDRMFETLRDMTTATVFGLTATLELGKAHVRLPAYNLAGPVIFDYPLEQGVDDGFLTKGLVVSVEVPQKAVVSKGKVDYQTNYKELIVVSPERNRVINQLTREAHGRGKHIVLITDRVKHIRKLHKLLVDIPHELVYGQIDVTERLSAKSEFISGNLRLLIVNKVFKKGINIKNIDVIIDCSAMKSRNDAIQKYGRGVRLCEDKDGLLYFDIADVSIPGLMKKSRYRNPLAKATKERRLAFKSKKIKVVKADFPVDETVISRIFDLAEARLRRISGAQGRLF